MKKLVSKDQAITLIKKIKLTSYKTIKVSLSKTLDRKSLEKIYSPIDLPELPTAGLDGYVVSNHKLQNIKLHKKEISCGVGYLKLNKNFAYRVNTGASVDINFKYLIPLEKAKVINEYLIFDKKNASRNDIKKIGEDLKKNTLILNLDERITEFKIALLASVGIKKINVFKKISVGVFSIGDEIVDLTNFKKDKSKIFDSNRYQIINFLKKWPVEIVDLGILKDNEKVISNFYKKNSSRFDLIISSGGSSSSKKDFISKFLVENSDIIFKYVKIKPGRPSIFSSYKNTFLFSLPGNPLAVSVNLLFLVSEFLNLFSFGKFITHQDVFSGFSINKNKDFNNFYRVKINNNIARLFNSKGSAKLISLSN
ncbi:MAG: molybdopterin molybdotransferase MoeA, partial [Proteobacteria bacterium]|nr:molybdopterin molybdotransferase MoeA [Pseudomonadota bacterium]